MLPISSTGPPPLRFVVRPRTEHSCGMQPIDTPTFLSWASTHGIGWDPRYPGTYSLTFLTEAEWWKPWDVPADIRQLSAFVETVLSLAAPGTDPLIVLPRDRGLWRFGGGSAPLCNDALDVVARGTGVAAAYEGAVRFDSSARKRGCTRDGRSCFRLGNRGGPVHSPRRRELYPDDGPPQGLHRPLPVPRCTGRVLSQHGGVRLPGSRHRSGLTPAFSGCAAELQSVWSCERAAAHR